VNLRHTLTIVAAGVMLACSAAPKTSSAPGGPAPAVATCAAAARPAETACLEALCTQGSWSLIPVEPHVACDLSPAYAERQAVAFPQFAGNPGVCYAGECLPRLLCVERCAVGLSAEYGPLIAEVTGACKQNPPEKTAWDCVQEVSSDPRLRRPGDAVLKCGYDCGFPEPTVATTTTPVRPIEEPDTSTDEP
jgi:hypothetical protein